MGAVYQAEHMHMRKRMAVKVLHHDMTSMPEVVARFEREAMAAAHIDHPNIAVATDFGKTDDGSFFLVLEFVEGASLRDLIARHAPLPVARVLHILRQIASALARAHGMGIVHRDLKPENVMLVERNGDPDFVKVLDFGIAKVPVGEIAASSSQRSPARASVLTQMGMVYGTPEYMAPEQAAGQHVDGRADQYALGIMTYEMLTGVRPFDHESKVALMGMHVTAPVPPMAEMAPNVRVPVDVEAFVMRLLEKDATKRFPDARDLGDAIESLYARVSNPFPRQPSRPAYGRNSLPDASALVGGAGAHGNGGPTSSAPGQERIETGAPLPVIANVPRRQPRIAVVGGVALAVGVAVAVGFMLLTNPPGTKEVGTGATASNAPSGTVAAGNSNGVPSGAGTGAAGAEAAIDKTIATASAAIEQGDDGTAVQLLGPLAVSHPDRVEVHRLLSHAYANQGKMQESLREADVWLRLDATAARDPHLLEVLRGAVADRDAQDEAFLLLEKRMGPAGADVLYELAYGSLVQRSAFASNRARQALAKKDVHDRASPALQVTLDLRNASGCDEKRIVLPRAREVGDGRTLVVLRPLTSSKGCGPKLDRDCWPCLRKDNQLARTVAALEERARGK
jgi:serine/threonine-protein kinase